MIGAMRTANATNATTCTPGSFYVTTDTNPSTGPCQVNTNCWER